jgi:predicted transcriptional regulator
LIDYLIDEELKLKDEYFYDTQYHLTKEGVDIKIETFLKHIKNYLAKLVTEDVNKMPDD